jgi:hypothetical protein
MEGRAQLGLMKYIDRTRGRANWKHGSKDELSIDNFPDGTRKIQILGQVVLADADRKGTYCKRRPGKTFRRSRDAIPETMETVLMLCVD